MATERETLSSLAFSIEDTVDTGEAQILSALYSDDTVTTDPDDIEDIQDEKEETSTISIGKQKPKTKSSEEEVEGEIDFAKALETSLYDGGSLEDIEVPEEGTLSQEKADEPKKEEKTKSTETEDENEEPIWASLSKDLVKIGVFTPDEDEEGNEVEFIANTPEEFKDKFVDEIKKGVNNTVLSFLSRYGEDYKQAFDAIFVNGVNPKDYFQSKIEVDNVKDLDLTREANQEYVVRKTLENQGFEGEELEEEIERLKNYGDLETTANRHHKVLVKKEEAKLKEKAESKAREIDTQKRIEDEYNENVFKILNDKYKAKEFDGIPVNKQFAEKTMDLLTVKKYQLPSGELITEWDKMIIETKRPENHGLKVKLAMLYQLLQTDPTLSTITKRSMSKETTTLFNDVARHKTKKSSSPLPVKPKRSFID